MNHLVFVLALLIPTGAAAQLMTVQQLKELLAKGPDGEIAATAYVQGVVDGMIGMDSLYQKEKRLPPEFCRFHDSAKAGRPVQHPAYQTKHLVASWKKQGLPMQTLAVDMVLAHLSAQYGCTK